MASASLGLQAPSGKQTLFTLRCFSEEWALSSHTAFTSSVLTPLRRRYRLRMFSRSLTLQTTLLAAASAQDLSSCEKQARFQWLLVLKARTRLALPSPDPLIASGGFLRQNDGKNLRFAVSSCPGWSDLPPSCACPATASETTAHGRAQDPPCMRSGQEP